jgi:hypothetical protein
MHGSDGRTAGSGHGGPGSGLAKKAEKHRPTLNAGAGEGRRGGARERGHLHLGLLVPDSAREEGAGRGGRARLARAEAAGACTRRRRTAGGALALRRQTAAPGGRTRHRHAGRPPRPHGGELAPKRRARGLTRHALLRSGACRPLMPLRLAALAGARASLAGGLRRCGPNGRDRCSP